MTATTDSIADVSELEVAEDKLESAVRQLEYAAAAAYILADDDDDEPGPQAKLAANLADLVDELHDALDCIQLALGRPYVWLLSRRPGDPDDDYQEPLCVDCYVNTLPAEMGLRAEWYIVRDEIWAAAGITPHGGVLCIGCLETRIGRQLTPGDFDHGVPLNDLSIADGPKAWSWRTPRLISRMSDGPA